MATTTSSQRISLSHPYKTTGIILVIGSLLLIAFDIGFLETCGNHTGVCIDFGTHRIGTAALILFFILFVIGVILIIYTGATTTTATMASVVPATPAVTVVHSPTQASASGSSVDESPPQVP